MAEKEQARFPDSLLTANRGMVRVLDLAPDTRIKVAAGTTSRWVTVKDIPINAALLNCGHNVRGIALAVDNTVFCDTCHNDSFVVEIFG